MSLGAAKAHGWMVCLQFTRWYKYSAPPSIHETHGGEKYLRALTSMH